VDTALPREVIEVSSGIYVENVFIGKPLTLKGVDTGNGKPIIDAGGYGSAVTLEAGGIVLDGFKLTGSGHCGCGNAGVNVASNNNTVTNNVITGNKYGVHVSDTFGNRFFNNDISENEIAVLDEGNNTWESGSGILGPIASLFGKGSKGNHYGEYDSPAEGCNDTNKDGVCDRPFIIAGGKNVDLRPLVSSP
jgi:parallel beta-helix repeat protein